MVHEPNSSVRQTALPGRLLAVGDIHGCATALRLLLERLRLTSADTLVLVGDLVDKGEDSRSVIEQLLALHCRLVVVMGNHDQALLEALDRYAAGVAQWEGLEQFKTFRSYGGVENIPATHIDFLRSAVPYWEAEGHVFVHANLQPDVPLEAQERYWLQMRYLKGHEQPYAPRQRVICGHTIQNSGVPWVLDGWVCIDTAAFHGGWLTCLNVRTDEILQTSERSETRTGTLAQLARHEPRRPTPLPADLLQPAAAATPSLWREITLLVVVFLLVVGGALLVTAL